MSGHRKAVRLRAPCFAAKSEHGCPTVWALLARIVDHTGFYITGKRIHNFRKMREIPRRLQDPAHAGFMAGGRLAGGLKVCGGDERARRRQVIGGCQQAV